MTTTVTEPDVIDLWSEVNRRRFPVWTWTPPGPGPFPVLLLLHGVLDSGGHGWWRKARAHETVLSLMGQGLETPPVLVMPGDTGVERGTAYADWVDGSTSAETYVMQEVLPYVEATLPVDGRRWVSGLSMGGYGALLLALRHPGCFASASSMSGFFDPARLAQFVPDLSERIWGGDRSRHDVTALILDDARRGDLRVAFDCGSEDELLSANQQLHADLTAAGVAHGYAVHPGGHTWDYWGEHLADHVRFHAEMPGPLSGGAR